MPVSIGEITSEVVLAKAGSDPASAAGPAPAEHDAQVDEIVRRAVERVLERLELEWGR